MTADGTPVRYLRSAFVPEDQRCFCFFEAADAEVVKSLNEQAQIPFKRVVAALDLSP